MILGGNKTMAGMADGYSNHEINEAVFRKLDATKANVHEGKTVVLRGNVLSFPIPDYAGSIEAAWEVIDKMAVYKVQIVNEATTHFWNCIVTGKNPEPFQEIGSADTAPLAIAKCFLKLYDTGHGSERAEKKTD